MVLIIELIFAFKVFDQVFVTTEGGPANASRVIMMYLYDYAFKWFNFGEALWSPFSSFYRSWRSVSFNGPSSERLRIENLPYLSPVDRGKV